MSGDWRTATRHSAGIAPSPEKHRDAIVQVYAARAFAWRGVFAVHSWISIKPKDAANYTTYEVMGWHVFHGGEAIQQHEGEPDRYWFGSRPEILGELRGDAATRAIGEIKAAVASYPWPNEYRTWPGPNSNSFTAWVLRNSPSLSADLPPTAIGKDYLGHRIIIGRSPSGDGVQLSLWGVAGILASETEGLEINLLGLSFGINPFAPAIRLPGIGNVRVWPE